MAFLLINCRSRSLRRAFDDFSNIGVRHRTLMLQGIYSRPQNGCADREAAALVVRDHLLSGTRRVQKPAANPPDRIAHGFCVQIEQVLDKGIGMNGPNSVWAEHCVREIAKIE